MAVGLVIVAFALTTLFHLLRDIEIDKVVVALRLTSPYQILIAGGFVAASYVTLTFYDYFSLRTIGRREVPYRIAAMASFISYTIGHNLGATVFTAGAIRFRIYSAWGLCIADVVKIAFITGLTFWLGNAFVLGAGLLWAPEAASAITQLPPWLNRAIALSGLAIITGYLLWLFPGPRTIGRGGWRITLPCARLTLVQIGIGVVDLTAGALAMHALLPADPPIDFVTVLVIFVTATLLGFLSHAPRQPWCVRGGDDRCATAIAKGGVAGIAADLPGFVFHVAVLRGRAAAKRARRLAGGESLCRQGLCSRGGGSTVVLKLAGVFRSLVADGPLGSAAGAACQGHRPVFTSAGARHVHAVRSRAVSNARSIRRI